MSQEKPKKPAQKFQPILEIEQPFAQFSGLGAEIAEGIDFADWARVMNLLTDIDYGRATNPSVDHRKDGNGGGDILATAGVLSSNGRRGADAGRAFDRNPPPRLGQLIELLRCLPPHDSIHFRLLHPLIVGIEKGEWLVNFEKGVTVNAKFRQLFNEMFEKSSREITEGQRSGLKGWGHLSVFSCAFWHSIDFTDDAEHLTGEYWRLILKKDYEAYTEMSFEEQGIYEINNEDVHDLKFWTTIVGGKEIDLDRSLITIDRALRFGLPRILTAYLIGDNPLGGAKRMADLYESFYILHDVAYLASNGYKEATVNERRPRDNTRLLIGDDGNVRMHKSLFWDIAGEEQIRAAQIRVCKLRNCRRIFWAKAKNRWCCTAECANLYETHKKRYPTAEDQTGYDDRWRKRQEKRNRRKPTLLHPHVKP